MTLVTIDLGDVTGGHDPDDHVVIRAEAFRESQGGGVTSTAEVKIPLVDGVGQAEVEPGPVVVAFRCRAVADTREKRGVVPDQGPVGIEKVLENTFEYLPPVVNAGLGKINDALAAALNAIGAAPYLGQIAATVDAKTLIAGGPWSNTWGYYDILNNNSSFPTNSGGTMVVFVRGASVTQTYYTEANGKPAVFQQRVTISGDGPVASGWRRIDLPDEGPPPRKMPNGSNIDEYIERVHDGDWLINSTSGAGTMTGLPVVAAGRLTVKAGAGIKFQIYHAYSATSPTIWMRNYLPGVGWGEWRDLAKPVGFEEGISSGEAALQHQIRADTARKRVGYKIPTSGRAVVMLRFDDYPQAFISKVLPKLRQYNLPAYFGVTKRWIEELEPTPWETVQDWFLKDGVRLWNHSETHSDALTTNAMVSTIVEAADYFESQMPQIRIDGWIAPGVGRTPPYVDFSDKGQEGFFETRAGRLIMSRHGIVNGGRLGYLQPMDGHPTGQTHVTYDSATLAQFKSWVEEAKAGPYALSMMLHPGNLDGAGNMSSATLDQAFAWLAAERDAGRIMVLTGDVAPALDAGGGTRHDMAPSFPTGSLSTTKTKTVSTSPIAWANGGVREFAVTVKADAAATVRLVVDGARIDTQKDFLVPAGITTVRKFFGLPMGTDTIAFTVSRVSGGAVEVLDAHVWAA